MILGTFLWGCINIAKSALMKKEGAHEDIAVPYEMLGATLVTAALSFCFAGGLPVTLRFWGAIGVTILLNTCMEYWAAKANKIEEASIIQPIAGTMPAFAVFIAWLIQGQWPSRWAYAGITSIAFGTYLLKLGGSKLETPPVIKRWFPKAVHERLTFFLAPWIRVFLGVGEKRDSFIGSWKLNGAQFALLIAWCGAISINFDQISCIAGNPALFSALVFGWVGALVFARARAGGSWSSKTHAHAHLFFGLGLLRGGMNILISIPLLFGLAASVGALKRLQILWTVLLAIIILGEGKDFLRASVRVIGSCALIAGAILIAF